MNKAVVFLSCLVGASFAKPSAFQAPGATSAATQTSRGAAAKMQAGDRWKRALNPARILGLLGEGDQAAQSNLKVLANGLNPAVGYYDPLKLAQANFWDQGNEATVGFLRHAEIKHGRVAMAAFVGYCLQSNGVIFPWRLGGDVMFKDIAAAGSPPEQWDALPSNAKLQILGFIGLLELWSESQYVLEQDGLKHYMRGGIPGKFPSFKEIPHPVPFDLYDPFGFNRRKTRQQLDKSLLAELNNGRLAQLGIMAFLAEQKVPGSVPLLKGIANLKPYAGEPMAPFSVTDLSLAFVEDMLKANLEVR